jgi:hypothetical protein
MMMRNGAAPGLWVRRVGRGLPVRIRRRVATAVTRKKQPVPGRSEAESTGRIVPRKRAGGAPGLWARRVGLSGPVGSGGGRAMPRAAEARRQVGREVGRVKAAGGEVSQIARAGGAEGGVSADVRRVDTFDRTSIGERRRVRFGDGREEQRRRVDAVR